MNSPSNRASSFLARGRNHADLGDHQKAIDDFTEAIRLRPDDGEAFYCRGLSHADLDDHEKAIDDFNDAIRLQPKHADAFYRRGHCHDRLNLDHFLGESAARPDEYQKAVDDYNEAILLQPDHELALESLIALEIRGHNTSPFTTSPKESLCAALRTGPLV